MVMRRYEKAQAKRKQENEQQDKPGFSINLLKKDCQLHPAKIQHNKQGKKIYQGKERNKVMEKLSGLLKYHNTRARVVDI
jgi:hypothetical protein